MKAFRSFLVSFTLLATLCGYFFLHYWGRGPAAELAKAVKNALDETAR
jgi:hypothetical protein